MNTFRTGLLLAALTGLCALAGEFVAVGDAEEGVIVLPVRVLPAERYRRCTQPPAPAPQLNLPGLTPQNVTVVKRLVP